MVPEQETAIKNIFFWIKMKTQFFASSEEWNFIVDIVIEQMELNSRKRAQLWCVFRIHEENLSQDCNIGINIRSKNAR